MDPELDAIDNALIVGCVMGLTLREVRRDLDEILAFAELERFAGMKLKHFSSGMSERLGYAIAFKAVRDVLVLDEIFAVGDAGFKQRCERRYRELRDAGGTRPSSSATIHGSLPRSAHVPCYLITDAWSLTAQVPR